MLKEHYKIETDVARVYKVRSRNRFGWGWAVATIREWPRGGQIDIQSDFGNYGNTWTAVGDRSLREFLCGLDFDYFMNKAGGALGANCAMAFMLSASLFVTRRVFLISVIDQY